jgi:transcriptional antiterminator NusG
MARQTKAQQQAEAATALAEISEAPSTEDTLNEEGKRWYVIHTYSGYENKVKANLEHRIETMDVSNLVFRVVIPTEEEIEIRDGQRRTVAKKVFPGYVLVQMVDLDVLKHGSEEDQRSAQRAWYVVRNTPGVTGFVGAGGDPVPLEQREVLQIMKQMRREEPRVRVGFVVGQSVRVIDGPFVDFVGVVDEINMEKGKVRVLVSFFGRETPVELDFLQVERL